MAQKTKDQLRLENDTNFPNNNTGFITAEGLRGFNDDMIESLALQSDVDGLQSQITANSESIEILSQSFLDYSSSLDNDFVSEAEFAAYTSSVNADSASVSTRVTDLENFSSSLSTDFVNETEFNAYTSSTDSRVDSLEAETGSLQSQIDSLALSGSGIVVENDGVSLGTATTLNFTGSSVTATYLGSIATIEVNATAVDTSSLATTGSNTFDGNQIVRGDLFVDGDLTARTLYIDSSSVLYTSGSNKFGDSLDDVQELTGSVSITGSFEAPLEDGYVWVGSSGVSTQIPSSSLVNAGTSGTSGINGLPGDNGTSGVDGDDGTSGVNGADGTSGVNGADGTSGVNGADGTSGINGLPGDNGTSGVNGADGTSGVNGADGTSGVNGADGTSGVNGADGTSGVSPLLSPYTGSVNILGDVSIDGTLSSTAVAQLTASWAENAISSSHSLIADLALNAKEIFVTAKNVSGDTIPKGTAVHSTGVTGENINIVTASYDDPNLMPAIGITQTDINSNGNGEVILTGRLIGFDTTGLVAGDNVYVNGTGALTATRPTGSSLVQNIGIAAKIDATDGEVIVLGSGRSNDVPNILEGYAWVGDSDGVAQPIATSSFGGGGSGEAFPYTGSALITGSLGVTGSITLENDGFSGSVVDNIIDTFTSVPAINHIVTLTETEYDGLGSVDENTLYVISGSAVDDAIFPYTGSIRGNVTEVAEVAGDVALDFSLGNFFSSSIDGATNFVVSNIQPGQTVLLKVNTTQALAVATFSSNVLQPVGNEYTASVGINEVDILTFTSFDGTNANLVAVNNLK